MKARKLFFLVALVAMVMALTSCGLSSDKQGTYLPGKIVYSGNDILGRDASGTYIIDWNAKTVTKNGAEATWNDIPLYNTNFPFLKIKASKANDSKTLSRADFESKGKDGIEWDLEHDVKEKDGNILIGANLGKLLEVVWYTLKPSDDSDYRYMLKSEDISLYTNSGTCTVYYNKY